MIKMDKLEEMLKLQREFQNKYNYHRPLTDWTGAMGSEVGELWEASGGKWWKHKQYTKEQRLEELVDLWHFILGYMIDGDISADEFFKAYKKKLQLNYARQETGY
jgi:dimeric dUTPase (all-alpha-NTP-PPase superfamily)